MTQPKTVIVIPTYNERENLPEMVAALFALGHGDVGILVVDDNSPDGTGQIADELHTQHPDHLHVLHRNEKSGLGKAYIAGFKHALNVLDAEQVIQMDCDFSHQPKYIPTFLELAPESDMVIGSRYVAGGGVDENWGVSRKLLSWFANRVYTNIILQTHIRDMTAGFRLWKRDTLIGMNLDQIESNGYVFQVEMAYLAYKLGYKIQEFPIYFPDRQVGTSKMTTSIAREAAIAVWQLRWKYRKTNRQNRRTEPYSHPAS